MIEKQRLQHSFNRAAGDYEQAAILQKEVCKRMLERLELVRINPSVVLDVGCGTGWALESLLIKYNDSRVIAFDMSLNMLRHAQQRGGVSMEADIICADADFLPVGDHSADILFSNLMLQWSTDIATTIEEFYRVLGKGGLVTFTTFGPDTLKELKQSWRSVDDAVHVNEFIDMHHIGDLLLQSGFAEPVMESEFITLTYNDVFTLMKDLKKIGASVMPGKRRKTLTTRTMLERVGREYEQYRQNGVLPVTYEVIYGHAWMPDSSRHGERDVLFTS